MAFTPSADLNAIQKILVEDKQILELLDLSGSIMAKKVNDFKIKNPGTVLPDEKIEKLIISENAIKRSQWDDLATSDKRLCIYFIPDRRARNSSFMQSIFEVDVHVPTSRDSDAWKVQERVQKLLHNTRINNRYTRFCGLIGELPTMQDFFCCGSRFKFYRNI